MELSSQRKSDILFQWTLIGWKQFSPHRFAAVVAFYWGFVATIQSVTTSWGGLMACRFFLGTAEAMFGPGVPLYLSFFYPRTKIGFRHGVFISGAAMANAYGGALGYALSHIQGSVAPWRLLFIIEGVPTCLLAVATWYLLPDSISSANFLSSREKAVAEQYIARQTRSGSGEKSRIQLSELLEAFKDPTSGSISTLRDTPHY